MGLAEDLEAITNAKNFSAVGCEPGDTLHNGAEPGNGAAAKIVTVGKPSRQDDTVFFSEPAKVRVLMPEHGHFLVQIILQGVLCIAIAIGSGENDDSEFHGSS
jgi:hypothetical protein